MFLTTIRIRRARRNTLTRVLPASDLTALNGTRDVVEVMAHGQTVALVDLTPRTGRVVWTHPDLQAPVDRLVREAITLMRKANEAGLCERVDEAA